MMNILIYLLNKYILLKERNDLLNVDVLFEPQALVLVDIVEDM